MRAKEQPVTAPDGIFRCFRRPYCVGTLEISHEACQEYSAVLSLTEAVLSNERRGTGPKIHSAEIYGGEHDCHSAIPLLRSLPNGTSVRPDRKEALSAELQVDFVEDRQILPKIVVPGPSIETRRVSLRIRETLTMGTDESAGIADLACINATN
jgi:hypothetical protein